MLLPVGVMKLLALARGDFACYQCQSASLVVELPLYNLYPSLVEYPLPLLSRDHNNWTRGVDLAVVFHVAPLPEHRGLVNDSNSIILDQWFLTGRGGGHASLGSVRKFSRMREP